MDNLTKSYLTLSMIGIVVAIYHSYGELTEIFTSCNISSTISCGGVFESGFTSLFGIPFYMLGLIWFPVSLLLGLWLSSEGKTQLRADFLVPLLMVGNAFTVYLWYLELGVIGIICPVCVSMYVINYAMTVVCVKITF